MGYPRKRGAFLRFCLPGYRWCGFRCSGPGPPVNAVDAACREHDLCYAYRKNYCACDREFMRKLAQIQNPYTKEGRHARMILQYMRLHRKITCLWS